MTSEEYLDYFFISFYRTIQNIIGKGRDVA